MVNNTDWDYNWLYTDPRINLLHCDDDIYLKFLATTLHPIVRTKADEVAKLLEIYNRQLDADGFEIAQTDEISGKPIFSGRQKVIGQGHLAAKKAEIKKYLNTAYVNGKINTMNDAIHKDTDLAIGTAKELLETTCKSILKQKGATVDPNWTLPQLLKETTNNLDFTPKEADDPTKADKAIRQILGGIASIVHGVAELRNGYGTGHGKDADFKGLEVKYAKLFDRTQSVLRKNCYALPVVVLPQLFHDLCPIGLSLDQIFNAFGLRPSCRLTKFGSAKKITDFQNKFWNSHFFCGTSSSDSPLVASLKNDRLNDNTHRP